MPLYYSIPVFLGSLTLMVFGSVLVSRALSRLGRQLHIPEHFLSFITALAADSPEISSTVVAMLSGQTDVGVGIVFGSNLFNLASLLGLTGIIAGNISVRRNAALLDGGVGVLFTGLAVMLAFGVVAVPVVAAASFVLVLLYAGLLGIPADRLRQLPIPEGWKRFLLSAATDPQEHGKEMKRADEEDERKRRQERQAKRSHKRGHRYETQRTDPSGSSHVIWIVVGSLAVSRSAALDRTLNKLAGQALVVP